MKIFGALAFLSLTAFAYAQQPQENLQALTTAQMIPAPEIYGPIFVDGAKVQGATGDFNPAIKLLQVALDISPNEAKALEGASTDIKKADDKIETEARKLNRRDPDFRNKYAKVRGGKTEKYLLIKNSFSGNKLNRFNYLFKASEVYHMPRLVSREEVQSFENRLRIDIANLSNEIGLDKTQSEKLYGVIVGYYSGMGHSLNDISLFQGHVGYAKKGEKDPVAELHALVNGANRIKAGTKKQLASFLSAQQQGVVEAWMGWATK